MVHSTRDVFVIKKTTLCNFIFYVNTYDDYEFVSCVEVFIISNNKLKAIPADHEKKK